jgi:hypothetical protein
MLGAMGNLFFIAPNTKLKAELNKELKQKIWTSQKDTAVVQVRECLKITNEVIG